MERDADLVGDLLSKEACGGHGEIGATESAERNITQALPDRVADHESAGENCDRRRHAEEDRGVGAPVIANASDDERFERHGCSGRSGLRSDADAERAPVADLRRSDWSRTNTDL